RAETVAQGRHFFPKLVGVSVRRRVTLRGLGRITLRRLSRITLRRLSRITLRRLSRITLRRLSRPRPARRHRSPPRAGGPFAEHPFHVSLTGHEAFQTRAHRALHELLPRLAVLDGLMQERRRQGGASVPRLF